MFNEANSVENFVRDRLTKLGWQPCTGDQLPRKTDDVLVETHLRNALVRLNPDIAARPDRADEVIYRLRGILLSVSGDGLVKANEEFSAWLHGERTMPFSENGQHVTINLIDYDDLSNNQFVVAQQVTYRNCRFDLVLYVNGMPLVVGEAKSATRPAVTWVDGAAQVHNDYEVNYPAFFVPNVFSFATEGKTYRYGSIRMPLELWAVWRDLEELSAPALEGLKSVGVAVSGMLRPDVVLDILQNFTLFATDKKHRKIKVICRYQQYQAVNQIVQRVVEGQVKKGLIWHFQGSGKSLLMVFGAQKLRMHAALRNPTVLIVVDRVDLDTQITATFNAADVPNTVTADTREKLSTLLAQDVRKVIITTIHKFGEADGQLNPRSNIIVLVDEAHRTQEGDLGRKMREALPNAYLFGLTGTPINKRDRNTFWAFGAEQDKGGYMSRYSFEESIRDNATLPLHFEARLVELRVDREAIDEAFMNLTGNLSESDQAELSRQAAKMAVLVKAPERVQAIVGDIVEHYQANVEPNGFKAMVVTFDRESCVLYKNAMDKLLPKEASEIIMSAGRDESGTNRFKAYDRRKDEEEKLLERFRDPLDPMKFLIVTARLLTGFDAPILQALYLDKPMKEHNLLQAICRTNRPYPGKTFGLIVDYIGVFDDVAKSLSFDEKVIQQVISNIDSLKEQVHGAVEACLDFFPGVDRTVEGYEGLIAAQDCLPNNETRDAFAEAYSVISQLWEALSPDPSLSPYRTDYRWLTQVYESVKPPSGNGKLLWHGLGAKTLELIHENIHVEAVRDDLDTLVMDADVLKEIMDSQDPQTVKEIEIKIVGRLRRHANNPTFIALGRRLEDLKTRFEQGILTSVAFLKLLLELAREVVEAEKQVEPEDVQQKARTALTELFNEARTEKTPIIIERIVNDIDGIVRVVRFPGWQQTNAGVREVKKALRSTLLKYQLHKEQDLFDKAYGYIEQYY